MIEWIKLDCYHIVLVRRQLKEWEESIGQSYKASTLVNYELIAYERRGFIRLATVQINEREREREL